VLPFGRLNGFTSNSQQRSTKAGRQATKRGWFVKDSFLADCSSDTPSLVIRRIFPKSGRLAEQKTSEMKMGKRKIFEAVDKQERIKRRKELRKLADLAI